MAEELAAQEHHEMFEHVLGDQPKTPVVESPPAYTSAEPPPAPTPETPTEPPKDAAEAAIPSWRLREEAEGRRAAEERARQLGDRLQQIEAHMRQQAQATAQKPDFFADPDRAVQETILRTLAPFAQEMHRQTVAMGKGIADAIHGADKVAQAEQAFLEAMNDRSLDTMDYERVVQAPNRYDEVVKWYSRQGVLNSVGDDPNAWFEQEMERRMADPNFQAKYLERIRGDAAKRPSSTELPPSLSRVTAARGNSEPLGDMSNESLFSFAMKR